ncbi:MAG: NAD-dependent epimerase/dehydratase family protein [Acidimicrobiales bacterium]
MASTVIVIGATGNLGTAVLERLAPRDDLRVVACARRMPQADGGVDRVTYRSVDLTADDFDEVVRGADAVVDLAWAIQPMRDPRRTWEINTGGLRRLTEALARAEVPTLVYASSIGTYAAADDDVRHDETWPPAGLGHVPYSAQKAYDEAMLDAFEALTNCRVVRLRPGLVLQRAAGSEYEGLFLGRTGRAAIGLLRALHLPVPLPRGLRFAVVAAADVARAVERALDLPDAHGAFNLAAEPPIRVDDLAEALGVGTVHVPWRVLRAVVRVGFAGRLVPLEPAWVDMIRWSSLLDTSRARDVLGWRPEVDARSALADAVGGVLRGDDAATPPLDR